ncbi:MAG: peptidase Ste24p [Candidatus Berkelbacteria bacterium]|nr:peptidase Ste24p [Candidatus Berkelbacteria bacterium]
MRHQVGLVAVLVVLLAACWSPLAVASDEGADIEAQYGVCQDSHMNARLDKVATRVSLAYRAKYPQGRRLTFKVLNDEDLNACALEDGRIYVTNGMMKALEGKPDDDLAAVLSHEATHVGARHHRKQMSSTIGGILLGAVIVKVAGGDRDSIETGAQIGGGLIGARRSKDDEYAADNGSVELLAGAGYNPRATADVMLMLQAKYGKGMAKVPVLGWFASHPDTAKRVDGAQRHARELGYGEVGGYQPPQSQPQASQAQTLKVRGIRVVVVVDPQATQSNGYGYGRGYYYNEDLSQVAKQEAETVLEQRGYQILVSTHDVEPLQDELDLENSEWGQNGQGRNPKGEFTGAQEAFYVSAYVLQDRRYEVGDWRNQARVAGLTVGVLLREIDVRTREQVQAYKGQGSINALQNVRASIGRDWNPLEVEVEKIDNLARKAVASAVSKAVPAAGHSSQPPARVQTPPAPRIDRPRDVEVSQKFTLNIRPKSRQAGDQRLVVARFDATMQEVVLTNRINFYRGNTVVASVDLDYQKSQPERQVLEGTLYAPAWNSLSMAGVTSIKLVEHEPTR